MSLIAAIPPAGQFSSPKAMSRPSTGSSIWMWHVRGSVVLLMRSLECRKRGESIQVLIKVKVCEMGNATAHWRLAHQVGRHEDLSVRCSIRFVSPVRQLADPGRLGSCPRRGNFRLRHQRDRDTQGSTYAALRRFVRLSHGEHPKQEVRFRLNLLAWEVERSAQRFADCPRAKAGGPSRYIESGKTATRC